MVNGKKSKKGKAAKKVNPRVQPQENSYQPNTTKSSVNSRINFTHELDCALCDDNHEAEAWYVQCDECDRCYHFTCVGITEIRNEDPWSCVECLTRKPTPPIGEPTSNDNIVNEERGNTTVKGTDPPSSMNPNLSSNIEDVNVATPMVNPKVLGPANVQPNQHIGAAVADDENSSDVPNKSSTNATKGSIIRDNVILNDNKTSTRAASVNPKFFPSQSISSKSTSSSQRRSEADLERIREELLLQEKIDQERLELKLEAIKWKEIRERRFLEEKYKPKSVATGSVRSTSTNATNRTSFVSSWIDDQQKMQILKTKSLDDKIQQKTTNVPVFNSSVIENPQNKLKSKSLEGDVRHFNGTINRFNFDCSIPLENFERTHLLEHYRRTQHLPNQNLTAAEIHTSQNSIDLGLVNHPAGTLSVNAPQFIPSSQAELNHPNQPKSNPMYIQNFQPKISSLVPNQSQVNAHPTNQSKFTNQSQVNAHPANQSKFIHQSQVNAHSTTQSQSMSQYRAWGDTTYTQNVRPIMVTSTSSYGAGGPQTTQSHVSQPRSSNSDYHSSATGNASIYTSETHTPGGGVRELISNSVRQQTRATLTANEIASRHAVPKELPKFSGLPGEWPRFIKRYENSTRMCGFSNDENLERLDKCLHGNARKIVECELTMPECVDDIIETLRQKFGRPEIIIKSVLAEIRKEPPIKSGKLEDLSNYGYKVRNVCKSIESLGLHYHLYNPELTQELVDKLPNHTKIDWARFSEDLPQVTLVTLSDWLYKLSKTLNRITSTEISANSNDRKQEHKPDRKPDNLKSGYLNIHESTKASTENSKCLACGNECKFIGECRKFKDLVLEARWELLKQEKLCRRCLKLHGRMCHSSKKCGINGCEYKHHPLLHNELRHSKVNSSSKSSVATINKKKGIASAGNTITQSSAGSCNTHIPYCPKEFFRIIPIVLHYNGRSVEKFAFLDEGSSFTLMERHVAEELRLMGTPETICLIWTNKVHRQEESEQVNLQISGMSDPNLRYPFKAVNLVDDLYLPAQSLPINAMKQRFTHLKGLPLIGFENVIPTVLIGLKHAQLSTPLETVEGEEEDPIATRSRLGWTVHGPMNSETKGYINLHQVKSCPCQDRDDEIHNLIKDHFTIENFGVTASSVNTDSRENEKALKLLKKFTIRKDNRFETRLLWKNETYRLPDSYPMAKKRLVCLENKGPKVVETINEVIEDYLKKGYVSKLSPTEIARKHIRTWYLPLFTVTNPKKPEKLRTVFDAAAKVKGVSLNSTLLTGPDLLISIVDVLRRFRENRIAVCGDIKEMYHQVLVNDEDKHAQRFLWRYGNKEKEPNVYVMNVMTFGSTCSPSAAQYVKNRNASEFQVDYPRAAEAIIKNHYVDDMMDGMDTIIDAIQLVNDVKFVHNKGGFEIRNFKSNSVEVLKAIGEQVNSDAKISVEDDMKTERVLGMFWDTKSDCFTFSLKYTKVTEELLTGKKLPTKREMLKLVMSIFDPLGLLSYYLIHLKITLQDVWRSKIGWDDPLPENLKSKWYRWIEILPNVQELNIPRWYSSKLSPSIAKKVELHVFVDASEDAYASVAYLRIETDNGCECSLIGSKARVTPLKYLSIPRKELMGSLLGTRLSNSIREGLTTTINRRILWSDSSTVLTWLHSEHQKYSQFVAHRVGEILEGTEVYEWKWVPTKLNIADEATKWSKTPTFNSTDRWFKGPEFLTRPESEWPKQPRSIVPNGTIEEMKLSCSHSRLIMPSVVKSSNFSKWERALRAVAFAIRWGRKVLSKVRKITPPRGPLSQDELMLAERLLFRQAQWEGFTNEMITLVRNQKLDPKRQRSIEKCSPIYDCTPYLDDSGVLRVQGRIDNALALTIDARRPIILPRNHQLTKLIMHSYHRKFLHRNHETAINELIQRFYVPRMRVAFRSVRWNCKLCEVKRCRPRAPQMADLPTIRLEPGVQPFTYSGIDYFGPLYVIDKRRKEKRWGVLITCLTIRAIHIEIVPSLSTKSCILAIENFMFIRGKPKEFYSDCGTNFKGVDNELKRELEKVDQSAIGTAFNCYYMKWNFNPPAAAHTGGCWERLISTVKSCLANSMTTRTPQDEELRNLLMAAMNVVNSRPLTYIPIDSFESEALTPNHFIIGSSNGLKPPGEFSDRGPYLRSSWKENQRCTNVFWKRFIQEYIPTLTRKTKWFEKVEPLKVGDIVINFDERNARNVYDKARIVEIIVGSKSQVRRAKIQMASGRTMWRPATKLGVLDVTSKTPTTGSLDNLSTIETGGNNVGASILNSHCNNDGSQNKTLFDPKPTQGNKRQPQAHC